MSEAKTINVVLDAKSTAVVTAAFMMLRAVFHSDGNKVLPTLHCDMARQQVIMAARLLDKMGLLTTFGWLDVVDGFTKEAVPWLMEQRPELNAEKVPLLSCDGNGKEEWLQPVSEAVN